ncbi:MAG: hypothetical protein U0794_04965 [Isosphaeraceae bacterium]
MKTTFGHRIGVVLGLGVLLLSVTELRGGNPESAQTTPPSRSEFMRQKLEFSKLILEGVTVENYDLITKNARNLRRLSTAAQWEVPTIPNANEYITFTGEFQRLCDDLQASAKEKNLDGATLAYLRLTMSCVNCHKYVRFSRR